MSRKIGVRTGLPVLALCLTGLGAWCAARPLTGSAPPGPEAKGKVILSKLNAPNTETEIAAKPPFSVIVGNAPEVKVFYNDREFDLEPHTKVAVARFTVE